MESFFLEQLEAQKTKGLYRKLIPTTPLKTPWIERVGQKILNFSSNDYLGLSQDERLIQSAKDALVKWGTGATSSRFVAGDLPLYVSVEEQIAKLKQKRAALVFNSGFVANSTVISTLTSTSVVFYDQYSHRSIIEGCVNKGKKSHRFRHNNLNHLEGLLKKYGTQAKSRWIITESIFSMDGDLAPLDNLIDLAKRYDAALFIDEAHATGVLGINGMGLTVGKDVDVVLGTFGKGLGSFGAYIACSLIVKEYLSNFCPGLIYTTALPPSILGAQNAALSIISSLDAKRSYLQKITSKLKSELTKLGLNTGNSTTQIIPIILGSEDKTLNLSQKLLEAGILASPIRPPTVPPTQSRLRISLTTEHTEEHLALLVSALKKHL